MSTWGERQSGKAAREWLDAHGHSMAFVALGALLLCNVLLVSRAMQGRAAGVAYVVVASALALGLWGYCLGNHTTALGGVGLPLAYSALLALAHALLTAGEWLGMSSTMRLGLAVALAMALPLASYALSRAGWRRWVAARPHSQQHTGLPTTHSPEPWSRQAVWLISVLLFLLGVYLLAVFDRPGILGWDTPNYVWRSRLIGTDNGLFSHVANYDNGLHLVFPFLVSTAHAVTRWDPWNLVQLLSVLLAVGGCLAMGWLVYRSTDSRLAAVVSAVMAAGYFPTGRFVADFRDNLAAWALGTLTLALLAGGSGQSRRSRVRELGAGLLLILTGFTHTAMAVVFFATVGMVGFAEFVEGWRSDARRSVRSVGATLVRTMRVPVLASVVVGAVLLPTLPTYLSSLTQFGLQSAALGDTASYSLRWLLESLQLATYWPWVLLGVLELSILLSSGTGSRGTRLLFAWSAFCLALYCLLSGRLPYRYFMMIPLPALVGLGVNRMWLATRRWLPGTELVGQALTLVVVLGLVFPINLAATYRAINGRTTWARSSTLQQMAYVRQYIARENLKAPYVFLITRDTHAMAFSFLYQNIIRASVPDDAILASYVYFGDLAAFTKREPTAFDAPELAMVGDYWWQLLDRDQVLERPAVAAFILKDFNETRYDGYLFELTVEKIGPGVLAMRAGPCDAGGD